MKKRHSKQNADHVNEQDSQFSYKQCCVTALTVVETKLFMGT